jgi:GntR family transcriptional regulator
MLEGGPEFERVQRGTPLPIQIARALAERITQGTLAPGAKLPGEPGLAQQFGVSRATIREATRLLVGEGLLESHRGRGTFVCREPHVWPVDTGLEELVSTTELIERAGYKAGSQMLEAELTAPSAAASVELGLEPGEQIRRLLRIRLADGVPVAYCVDSFGVGVLDESQLASLDRITSLLALLERAGSSKIARAITRIEPIAATPELMRSLKVARNQPLLLLRETYYTESATPILYSENSINTELLSFHVRRSPKP